MRDEDLQPNQVTGADRRELIAAKREVDGAVGDLAARPLDEDVADRMREILESPRLRKARRTLWRLQQVHRPRLTVVTENDTTGPGRAAARSDRRASSSEGPRDREDLEDRAAGFAELAAELAEVTVLGQAAAMGPGGAA